tara:strand:+ start:263 stop:673 length:411 start_codon:yes stop_codon:yes gene_type:complete
MSKKFIHYVKVYYEDTDAEGVVYYANYLKFLERARTEAIFSLGLTNTKLLNEYETLIIVKSCNINYIKPAKFEDNLKIISKVKSITRTSFLMYQVFERDNEIISEAEVRLVTINKQGKPIQIPKVLEVKFKEYLSN